MVGGKKCRTRIRLQGQAIRKPGTVRWVTARRDGARSLERLLDGAQSTFAERGYRAASIHKICAGSRVGIGTFYAHVADRRQLLQRVCVERALPLTTSVTPAILSDHRQLVAFLRRVNDDPGAAGLLRAWYEAVLEEPEIARFHGRWRASTPEATTVAEAQHSREMAIHHPRRHSGHGHPCLADRRARVRSSAH
jgi:AcrR family transcriptional regulator